MTTCNLNEDEIRFCNIHLSRTWNIEKSFTLENVYIKCDTADCITLASGQTLEMMHSTIEGVYKGTCLNIYGNLSMKGSVIFNCGGKGNGGGIRAYGSSILTVDSSSLKQNEATLGGAFYLDPESSLKLTNSDVSFNSAYYGAALYADYAKLASIYYTKFTSNRAEEPGGILVFQQTNAAVYNCDFNDNSSSGASNNSTISCYSRNDEPTALQYKPNNEDVDDIYETKNCQIITA